MQENTYVIKFNFKHIFSMSDLLHLHTNYYNISFFKLNILKFIVLSIVIYITLYTFRLYKNENGTSNNIIITLS